MTTVTRYFRKYLKEYPAIGAGLLIYGYYLISTIFVFRKSETVELGMLDYFFQYDSLILLWIVAYLVIRSFTKESEYQKQKRNTLAILAEAERSEIAASVLNDVVHKMQDRINNPLTVIASHTDQIRKKMIDAYDEDVLRKLDHIDALLQKIHIAIKDTAAFKSQSLLEELQAKIKN